MMPDPFLGTCEVCGTSGLVTTAWITQDNGCSAWRNVCARHGGALNTVDYVALLRGAHRLALLVVAWSVAVAWRIARIAQGVYHTV